MLGHPAHGFCPLCGQLVPGWQASVMRARAVLSAAMSTDPNLPPVDDPLDPDLPDDPDDDDDDTPPGGAPRSGR
jgi:hypothetical protein